MTSVSRQSAPTAAAGTPLAARGWALAYALTVLTSAFLLFQVQPLIAKFILPWFGGGPAIWTTCMVFFQTVLFAGYAYAHLIASRLSPRAQVVIHAVLLVVAVATLPITPSERWKPTSSASPVPQILLLLAGTVGLPYFVLSSTGPLLQEWFRRSFPQRSPYRLYALSNAGSLAALISYPFVVEPALDILWQAKFWSVGFGLFALLCGISAAGVLRASPASVAARSHANPAAAPSMGRRAVWLGLAALGSLMLVAGTNHLCQDIAVFPFLWVGPLSLYLLSFIIAFDHPRWYSRRVVGLGAMIAVVLVGNELGLKDLASGQGVTMDFYQELVIYFSALLLVFLLAHGELALLRPDPAYLTSYYLIIAAGGAIGGMFVSLVAPLIFATFLEWRIGVIAAFLLATLIALIPARSERHVLLAWRTGIVVLCIAGLITFQPYQSPDDKRLYASRNFYGVLTVWDTHAENPAENISIRFRELRNGVICHGVQHEDSSLKKFPTSYYSPNSGAGLALKYLSDRGQMRVGAVGLGAGTLATYLKPGDTIRFYEINPDVVDVAKKYFTFLGDCQGKYEIALGDARLSLEREASQQFDLIALDAFSGDAIPVHLLTKEAIEIYLRHLKPRGIIAVHISNRFLDLERIVYGLAQHYKLGTSMVYAPTEFEKLIYSNTWILLSRDEDFLEAMPRDPASIATTTFPLWTDHSNNLFQLLR